ncbi:MAG: GNAT family N-acetyltransferase [Acidobacteriota bacterium]
MAVNLSPLRSRIQNKPQERVPYIEYVEAAPWNLAYYSSQPRFRGVGTMLLAAAIQQSLDAGHSGAIALHSLPQAEEFYRRCGFADLGLDSEEENLRYFEMSTGQAARFLKEALNG